MAYKLLAERDSVHQAKESIKVIKASNRYHGEVEISPLMKAAWEYETEIMKEYFGPESLWRWDGL